MRRRLIRHAFPPNAAVIRQRDVGKNRILRQRLHGVRVGAMARAGGDTKETGLRINRAQATVSIRLDPRDIVADRPNLPALLSESGRRYEHGKIRLTTRAGESRRHVGFFALGVFDAQDQHVFRHPAFVARHGTSDAEGETFLPQQSITAVAGTVRPDFARLGTVDDVFLLVTRPSHILLPWLERSAHRMNTRHYALKILIDQLKNPRADAGHDAHVDDGVRRVGQLDADLRHRRTDRAHAVSQHIHRATPHAAIENSAESFLHLIGIYPVVGRTRRIFRLTTNKSTVFDARDIGRVGARVVTARPLFLI